MSRIILALDLGTNLALAHDALGDPVACSVVLKGPRHERATETMGYLQAVLKQFEDSGRQVDLVVYERPFARGMDATRCLWGQAGIIEAVANDHGAAILDPTPSEIKKFTTGSGKGSKDDMLLFASTTGYPGENEHEADAWCLLRYAQQTFQWEDPKCPTS